MREVFDRYEREAEACLEQGLVLPAHDYVLKCSHIFNTLDTRGAVGVTERQAYFRRMRELARRVAEAYLEQRKLLEYPLLKEKGLEARKSNIGSSNIALPNVDFRASRSFSRSAPRNYPPAMWKRPLLNSANVSLHY